MPQRVENDSAVFVKPAGQRRGQGQVVPHEAEERFIRQEAAMSVSARDARDVAIGQKPIPTGQRRPRRIQQMQERIGPIQTVQRRRQQCAPSCRPPLAVAVHEFDAPGARQIPAGELQIGAGTHRMGGHRESAEIADVLEPVERIT